MAALGTPRARLLARPLRTLCRSSFHRLSAGYLRIIDAERLNALARLQESSLDGTQRRPPSKPRIAAFIDGDQVAPSAFAPALAALAEHGDVALRRFYTNEHKAELWARDLRRHGIEPVVVPKRDSGGTKDVNDMAIALDVAELLLAPTLAAKGEVAPGPAVSGVAVVSNDADFTMLLRRVQDWGALGYAAVRANHGRISYREVYESAGVTLVSYAIEKEMTGSQVFLFFERNKMTTKQLSVATFQVPVEHDRAVVQLLASLGYIPAGALAVGLDAFVKFFHVNQLGPCMICPFLPGHAYQAIASGRSVLVADPGNLMLVDRVSTGTTMLQKMQSAGGPVLLTVGPALVGEVLAALGFVNDAKKIDDSAIAAFCEVNQKYLAAHKVDLSGKTLTEKMSSLHACFAAQHVRQQWRIMPSDGHVRRKLFAENRIPAEDAPQELVLEALRHFLNDIGVLGATKLSYDRAVIRWLAHLERANPELRK